MPEPSTTNSSTTNQDNQTRAASMSPFEDGAPNVPGSDDQLDDQGTSPKEAIEVLRRVRDGAFDSSNEKLALALGRPVSEIDEWLSGAASVDGDVLMKARHLASTRGLEIE